MWNGELKRRQRGRGFLAKNTADVLIAFVHWDSRNNCWRKRWGNPSKGIPVLTLEMDVAVSIIMLDYVTKSYKCQLLTEMVGENRLTMAKKQLAQSETSWWTTDNLVLLWLKEFLSEPAVQHTEHMLCLQSYDIPYVMKTKFPLTVMFLGVSCHLTSLNEVSGSIRIPMWNYGTPC